VAQIESLRSVRGATMQVRRKKKKKKKQKEGEKEKN